VTAEDLLKPSLGTITTAGFYGNVEVCVRYLAAWLAGNGCVPIHGMMEDAATAEISRAQLWQWLHNGSLHLADGTPVDFALLERALIGLPSKLAADPSLAGAVCVDTAIALLTELTHRQTLEDFLTLPAYERID
jgi:malate synthase